MIDSFDGQCRFDGNLDHTSEASTNNAIIRVKRQLKPSTGSITFVPVGDIRGRCGERPLSSPPAITCLRRRVPCKPSGTKGNYSPDNLTNDNLTNDNLTNDNLTIDLR